MTRRRAIRAVVQRLARSAGAGIVATIVDVGSLAIMVSAMGIPARVASVPALVLGSIAAFFGQKIAFQSRGDARSQLAREMALFAIVQGIGLVLTALLYDRWLAWSELATKWYWVTRLLANNVVWLGFSFPAWHYVFRDRERAIRSEPPRGGAGST